MSYIKTLFFILGARAIARHSSPSLRFDKIYIVRVRLKSDNVFI